MMRRLNLILLMLFLMVNIIPSTTQNEPSKLRTNKKVISVNKVTAPYYAIQILAVKDPTKNVAFFQNMESIRMFSCNDGYKRYVVGKYATQEEAMANLDKIRAKGVQFQNAYVVNTADYNIEGGVKTVDKSTQKDKFSRLRTTKKIIPVDKATEPFFAIQLLALKALPQDPNFFENVSSAREFTCQDGYARYVVGQYDSYESAVADLSRTKGLSVKYQSAFVVNTSNYNIQASAFSAQYDDATKTSDKKSENKQPLQTARTSKKITPVDKFDAPYCAIQVLALKEAPMDAAFFEKIDEAREASCVDGFKRYLVGRYNVPEDAKADCDAIRKLGAKYKNAFIVNTQKLQLEGSAFTSNYTDVKDESLPAKPVKPISKPIIKGKTESAVETAPVESKSDTKKDNAEKTSLRTSKKIMPVDNASKPFYTVQILALKEAPQDPNFFDNIESAREFSCKDGYKRYVVGQYESPAEAAADLARIKGLDPKYKNAFIANTATYDIALDAFRSHFDANNVAEKNSAKKADVKPLAKVEVKQETKEEEATDDTPVIDKPTAPITVFDPNKTYTIQLTASRYPFYVSEFKQFKEVFEFYMPDKVYRYSVGKYKGAATQAEVKRVISLGYKEAFAVEWDKYAPYQIE